MPSPRSAANPASHPSLPRENLPRIAPPLPSAGSSPACPGRAAVNTCSSRTDMNRLKRGYAVRSIDAITHPDQLPLRQADLTNAIGRAGPDGHHHPSSPGAPLQSAEPHSMIHSWRVLCSPWPHPYQLTFAHSAGASFAVLGPGREDLGPALWRWWRMCRVEVRDGSEGLLGLPRHAGVDRAEAAAVPRRFRVGGTERP